MRLRSRGLGRKELVLDFREYELVRVDDELVVVGTIRDPVNWDFTIRICEDDIPGMIGLALQRGMLGVVLRSLFKRRKRHHWGQEHAEHLAEGKARRETARANASERARDSMQPLTTRRRVSAPKAAEAEPPAPRTGKTVVGAMAGSRTGAS